MHMTKTVCRRESTHIDPLHANLEQVFVLVGYKKFNVNVIVPT
jgi:hypothetical protein